MRSTASISKPCPAAPPVHSSCWRRGRLPAGINHLRVGEGLLYGEDTTGMRFLEGYHTDAFHFKAQVVELRRKPSVPIGEHGRDGKGGAARIPRPGVHLRAICAAGKQDVAWAALTPPAGGRR